MRGSFAALLLLSCGAQDPQAPATVEVRSIEVERGELLSVALDGDVLVAGSSNDHLRRWTWGESEARVDARGHRRGITCVALETGGGRVATGGPDRTVRLWDSERLQEARALDGPARPPIALAFGPDDALVAASMGGELFVWDATSGDLRLERPGPAQRGVMAVALSADGTRMVWAADGGNLRVWDTATGAKAGGLRVDGLGFVGAVALAPDGKVATGARDTTRVSVWDLEREALLCAWEAPGIPRCLAFAPDGVRLAVATTTGGLQLVDARTGAELGRWTLAEGEIRRVAFDPAGARLAAAGPGGRATWIHVEGLAAPDDVVTGTPLDAPVMRRGDAPSEREWPTQGRIELVQLTLADYDPPELRADPTPWTLAEFPERARVLHGRTITTVGYPLATEHREEGVTRFLLSRFPPGCCFGSVPVPDEWIEVTVETAGGFHVPEIPVEVTGVLEVGEVVDELGFVESLYRMRAEEVARSPR